MSMQKTNSCIKFCVTTLQLAISPFFVVVGSKPFITGWLHSTCQICFQSMNHLEKIGKPNVAEPCIPSCILYLRRYKLSWILLELEQWNGSEPWWILCQDNQGLWIKLAWQKNGCLSLLSFTLLKRFYFGKWGYCYG